MPEKVNYNPDILSCLANLSSDEVFTPPEIANSMLDMLPQELFKNPNTKFLDPGCKSGVFLREIAKRLNEGLKDKIPAVEQRMDHIMKNQLFAIAITQITGLMSRRSVYCSKDASSRFSITRFENSDGNIRYRRIEHTWENSGNKEEQKCVLCGASRKEFDRGSELESHAYEFIHMNDKKIREVTDMKFDVVIGNPPYQIADGGNGASAKPIYHLFIQQAKKLRPRYLIMITPSRWFAGGKGLDDFREEMLNDRHISRLVDYVNAKDCFPQTSIGGGVNYFLWDREYKGECDYTNIHDNVTSRTDRDLSEFPVFIRYNEAISIIHKVSKETGKSVSDYVFARNPFGISSSERGTQEKNDCLLISSGGFGYISLKKITQGQSIVDSFKVVISKVTCEHAGEPDKNGQFRVVSTHKILKPKEVCTDSYLVLFESERREEVENYHAYLCSKFFRFLLLQSVSSINLSKEKFQFVPIQDFSKPWTDEELYAKYRLSDEEIAFIESMIKPMDIEGGADA